MAVRDFPPNNIWRGESSAVVISELARVTPSDMTINLLEDVLTLERDTQSRSRTPIGNGASALMAHFRARSNCHSGSILTRSKRV
jgi:hypothetical protein